MSVVAFSRTRPLAGGFYTVSEAARLLKIDNELKIRGWLRGYGGDAGPVIERQYPLRNGTDEIGFYDLMEIRFIEYFRRQKISLQSIRKAAAAARSELGHQHPFALSNIKFVTDRKRIFHLTAEETKDTKLRDIVTGQYAMYDVIEQFLAKGIEFHPASNLPESWRPDPETFPDVILDPHRAHGLPILAQHGVPTSALFGLWRAEEQDYDAVADWYEIPREAVEQAVEYELDLAA
ncbi:DUF433 domain-containing protein [Ensifer sp. ENS07]|uniref:DUF433 domain-containing protein n=1 Tax=unclassified Ensifer TaxID=2633371 RepID=UPI00178095A7|nr:MULTISPECIES: DUF433 domain-containing protein [unclassified Ensifer]MBD9507938.1 DUF433 domain-containing protein [Ensifer sp. ENS10]MBD9637565.1 DUF433 domain-containing protein [Ensifer sp. ENS07]